MSKERDELAEQLHRWYLESIVISEQQYIDQYIADAEYNQGWNACCDAHKLAGYRRVPSVEEIAELIKKEGKSLDFRNGEESFATVGIKKFSAMIVKMINGLDL